MNRYFIDDIISKLLDLKKDGYSYCTIYDSDGDEDIGPFLSISAEDCGGFGSVDYDDISPVSLNEISEYAFQFKEPPVIRDRIVIEDEYDFSDSRKNPYADKLKH